jgi:NTP pyrophosphatase (non-canonical NTP hydrolase)
VDIEDILNKQIKMDELHGFPVKFKNSIEKYNQLTKDLVGLFGEIGEFSNIVKKINIKLDKPNKYELDIDEAEILLREELIDSFIYFLRISSILDIDVEKEILEKMQMNLDRYRPLRDE